MTKRAIATKGATISTTVITMAGFSFDDEDLNTAKRAVVSAVTQNAMMTWDGTDPTATLGHPLLANYWHVVERSANIQRIKLIRQGGSDSTVTITLEF